METVFEARISYACISTNQTLPEKASVYNWKGFPFPVREFAFLADGWPGVCSGKGGCIVAIHLPTNDVWMLFAQDHGALGFDCLVRFDDTDEGSRQRILTAKNHLDMPPKNQPVLD